ncbi:hypothetical protein DXG01_011007 [Tephrocybe rancida]|nr:hypothetical protein DXG01_011007 [Tephrocybe rancida]
MSQPSKQDSDSEDDDYVPPVEASSSDSDDQPDSKRPRISPPQEQELDETEKKRARDALWSSFQASVSSAPSTQAALVKEMVTIEKRFNFAGEIVVEVVEVPADSPDAKKWPQWRDKEEGGSQPNAEPSSSTLSEPEISKEDVSGPSTPAKPATKRPGPRKSKVTLAAIPTVSTQRAKKLSTLDKSAMDWQAHVRASGESGLKDELDANRRGGGYLEKVEFLNRVEGRREEVIEASKGSKRRRN